MEEPWEPQGDPGKRQRPTSPLFPGRLSGRSVLAALVASLNMVIVSSPTSESSQWAFVPAQGSPIGLCGPSGQLPLSCLGADGTEAAGTAASVDSSVLGRVSCRSRMENWSGRMSCVSRGPRAVPQPQALCSLTWGPQVPSHPELLSLPHAHATGCWLPAPQAAASAGPTSLSRPSRAERGPRPSTADHTLSKEACIPPRLPFLRTPCQPGCPVE